MVQQDLSPQPSGETKSSSTSDKAMTPIPSPNESVAQQQTVSDDELVEFVVAVFRLLVISTFAFFRMGPQTFVQAIGGPVVGDALRAVTNGLHRAVGSNTEEVSPESCFHLQKFSHQVPATASTAAPPQKHDIESSDSLIAVSCGLRVGVFNDWTEAGPYCAGVSGAVFRACDTLEEARGAFLYAMDRGLVVVKGGGVAPDVFVTANNISVLSGSPESKINGIDMGSLDVQELLQAYYDRPPKKYYVVTAGLRTGVFSEWLEVGHYVLSVPGALYRGFDKEEVASRAFDDAVQADSVRVILMPQTN